MSTRQREDNDGGNEVKIDGDFYEKKGLKKMKEYLRSEYEKKTKMWGIFMGDPDMALVSKGSIWKKISRDKWGRSI